MQQIHKLTMVCSAHTAAVAPFLTTLLA